jgi:hypothetical protein
MCAAVLNQCRTDSAYQLDFGEREYNEVVASAPLAVYPRQEKPSFEGLGEMISKYALFAALAAIIAASAPAHADVVISSDATSNMSCSAGACVPTTTKAVLNAGDLQNYLSQFGNVRVMTTGNGVEANNIVVNVAFASPASTSLTLDAHKAITINAAVSIGSGAAELELQSDTGGQLGTLLFGRKGHITFGSLSDIFGINGGIFTLVNSVQGLASAIAANPAGAYALANDYDASADGTYVDPPVTTTFTGTLDGLGNVISKLKIRNNDESNYAALFEELGFGGVIRDIGLTDVSVQVIAPSLAHPAALVGLNEGEIANVFATGHVKAVEEAFAGGLVAAAPDGTSGVISNSYAAVAVTCGRYGTCGGLVGFEVGTIEASFATGPVRCSGGCILGGLVGQTFGAAINDSYATGDVSAKRHFAIGGLIGVMSIRGNDSMARSYSMGAVSTAIHRRDHVGGSIGVRPNGNNARHVYWDTTTSGTNDGVGFGKNTGITGLTTEQLQSGLPAGFDPKIWAENSSINNGLPYLIANPPPK